ncbi:MAG: hypothetical protein ACKOQ2_15165, partial [Dolichospermum sp.]
MTREQGTGNREQGTGNRFWATLLFVTDVGFFPLTYLYYLQPFPIIHISYILAPSSHLPHSP